MHRRQTGRWSLFAIGVLTWIGLVLQFYLSLRLSLANGRSVLGTIVFFFSFFTILTNSLIAFQTIVALITPKSPVGAFFSSPAVQTGTAIYIAVVGIVYSLVLRELWNPEGAQKLADLVLHDLVPILYVAWWFFFVPKNGLRWKHAVWWWLTPLLSSSIRWSGAES